MAVYYRYRSGVDTFSVPVAASTISVSDLKRLILGTSRHGHGRTRGRGPRESVVLSDARTGEEYADDDALVPRNSTVVVRRVAGPPAETITVAPPSPKATTRDGGASSGSAARSGSTAQDEEDRAISAVIDAAQLTWEGHRPYQGRRGAQEQRTPPAGYVCHRCHVPGHFIQHCPTNGDPRFDFGRASSATHLPAPAPASSVPDGDDWMPPELHCRMCKKVMADAVVTSRCCFDSFCDACIRGRIVAESKCVCGAPARADDLVPNQTLRVTIANMLATRAAAGGADNQKTSSAGSNDEPTSQNPDASQGSRSQVTAACSEHSDGSASSSSTSKIAAAHQPRTTQATAESTQDMARGGYPEQYGCGDPFGPALYDPFFGGMPWAPDPYMYYGVPFAGGYPIVPVPAAYHDGGGHGRKRTADGEGRRPDEPGLKRMRRSRSMVAV